MGPFYAAIEDFREKLNLLTQGLHRKHLVLIMDSQSGWSCSDGRALVRGR